jgi:hypothetical protein
MSPNCPLITCSLPPASQDLFPHLFRTVPPKRIYAGQGCSRISTQLFLTLKK